MTKEFTFSDGGRLYVAYEGTAGTTTAYISADENLSDAERTLDISFVPDGGDGVVLHIVQSARSAAVRITSENIARVDGDGGVRKISND
ncbi:MAG: hypothetical protein LUC22_03945 [Prevotella sp.]|nr:hypothetical protein [Prevotella sp.]